MLIISILPGHSDIDRTKQKVSFNFAIEEYHLKMSTYTLKAHAKHIKSEKNNYMCDNMYYI